MSATNGGGLRYLWASGQKHLMGHHHTAGSGRFGGLVNLRHTKMSVSHIFGPTP